MHMYQQQLSLNDYQVPRISMFPQKFIIKNCKQHGHSPRYLTMALNQWLRKNDTFLSPASEYKVLLYNPLNTFYIRGRRRLSRRSWRFFDCHDNTRSIAIIPKPHWHVLAVFYSVDLTSSTELRSRLSLWVQNLLRWWLLTYYRRGYANWILQQALNWIW